MTGARQASSVRGTLRRVSALSELAAIELSWRQLEEQAEASFFLSWGWLGPWVRALAERAPIYLFRAELGARTVGLAFLSRRRVRFGKGLIVVKQFQLNQFDAPQCDMIIEYNGVLSAPGFESESWRALAESLRSHPEPWDEFLVRSLSQDQHLVARAAFPDLREEIDRVVPSWAVSLTAEHAAEESLMTVFKRKTRQQMRQTMREFDGLGEVSTSIAATAAEALTFFDDMGTLHRLRWTRVGKSGAFANGVWTDFHRDVIAEGFQRGEVVISRVSVAGEAVGFVYAHRWRDRLYAQQTGFKPLERAGLRSGYLTHFRTMLVAAAMGIVQYNLLPDDGGSYKRLLADELGEFTTARFQRKRFRFWALRQARRVWGKLHQRTKAKRPRSTPKVDSASDTPEIENAT